MSRPLSLVIAGSLLVLAACGGAGTASQPTTTGPAGGGLATSQPGATSQAAVTAAPVATDGGGTGGGGTGEGGTGGGSADVCALLTSDEVAQATGQANLAAGPIPAANLTDATGGCAYVSAGTIPVINLVLLDPQNTNANPDDMKLLPQTEEIQVSGARAMWMPAAGSVLFVYRGGRVVMIQVLMAANDDIKATAASLAQKVADRM